MKIEQANKLINKHEKEDIPKIKEQLETNTFQIDVNNMSSSVVAQNGAGKIKRAIVSFCSDDGCVEDYTYLKPLFDKYKIKSSLAISGSMIGKPLYMSLEQLKQLYKEGWDIQSHCYSNDFNMANKTESEIDTDIKLSFKWFKDNGFYGIENIIYPQGGVSATVYKVCSKYFKYGTRAGTSLINYPPIETMKLNRCALGSYFDQPNNGFTDTSTYEYYKYKVDKALESGGWLIFMLHSGAYNGQFDDVQKQNLENIIKYIQGLGIEIKTIKDGFSAYGNVIDVTDYNNYGNPVLKGNKYFRVGNDGTFEFTDDIKYTHTTTSDATIYINSSTGDDSTGDGTVLKPYKTPNFVLNILPTIINHNITIDLTGDFSVYNVPIRSHFGNGSLTITSSTLTNCLSVSAKNTQIPLTVKNLKSVSTTGNGFSFIDCCNITVANCSDIVSATSKCGIYLLRCQGRIGTTEVSNKNEALKIEMSTIVSQNNTGTGNTTGMYVFFGGVLIKYGTQPQGTTNESKAFGGNIYS